VERCDGKYMDTCCIDDQGNMIFVNRGELLDVETAQKFVDENHIRFSIAFGPVLIEDYQRIPCSSYIVGEIYDRYPRAALCQKDALHYVVVVANSETPYSKLPTLPEFGRAVESCGFEKAYTLDGGQTAVIAMQDALVNKVFLGAQRQISDIFYFATAVPDGTAAAVVETDK